MRIPLLSLLAACVLSSVAVAQRPTNAEHPILRQYVSPVDGPTKYKPYTLVRLKAENIDPKAAVIWRVSPSAGVQRANTPKGTLEFVAPPGVYSVDRLTIRTSADGGIEVDEWSTTVEIERDCDKVPPAPVPPPNPMPPTPPAKPKADPWNALGRIQFGSAGCTATVMYPRLPDGRWQILTANHCIEHVGIGAKGQMQLRGKADRFTVKVVAADAKSDCAWLVTESADLGDLPFAHLAEVSAPAGVKIWHGGFGVDTPGNREDGSVTRAADSNGQTELALSVSSGDSGGGMFRDDTGELISTVCCTTSKGTKARVWGANVESIRKLRPVATADTGADWWTPVDVPEKKTDTATWWKPVDMPTRGPVVIDVRR